MPWQECLNGQPSCVCERSRARRTLDRPRAFSCNKSSSRMGLICSFELSMVFSESPEAPSWGGGTGYAEEEGQVSSHRHSKYCPHYPVVAKS